MDKSAALSPLQLGRASLTYAVGGLAYKGVALLAVPFLARLLSPAQLGLLDLAVVLASVAAITVGVGTDQGIPYFEPRTKASESLWGSAIVSLAVGGILAVLVALALQGPISAWVVGDAGRGSLVVAAAVYGVVMALCTVTMVTIRLRASAATYAISSFLIVTAEMVCALTVAWVLEEPVVVMVLAWSAGAAAVAVPLLVRHLPHVGAPRISTVRRLVRYGAPLIPATLAWVVGEAWIRSTLARQSELATLGEYGIAFRIAGVMGLLVAGFGVAWYPYLFRSPAREVTARAAEALSVVVPVLGGVAVAITALSPEVVALVAGAPYAGATNGVAPLVGGMVAMGMLVVVGGVIASHGSTRRVGTAAIVGMLVQFAVAAVLVERFGLLGAATASLFGYATAASIVLVHERSLLRGARGLQILVALVATAAMLVAAHAVLELPLLPRMILAVAGLSMAVVGGMQSWPALRPESVSDE